MSIAACYLGLMVNPGSFRGSRKDFLLSQKAAYAEAVTGGYVADILADIQRKYFKRYPIDFPHDEEPSLERLQAVDDDAPDPEQEEPDREKLGDDEYAKAIAILQERTELIRFRKAQIKRWMTYQYMKDHDVDPMEPTANNPFNHLIYQLTGKEPGRPRKKTAVNVWRKSLRHNIEMRVKSLAKSQGIPNGRLAALRDKVARDMFNELPADQQEKWKKQAEEETAAANEEWERLKKADPSTKPEDRQLCITGLVRVTQPILEMLMKTTGWNFTLLGGGPEPAHGGQLNIISVHSGCTPGDVKMNFGRAERADYKKYIVPIFGRFLKKCFSPEECRARALTDITDGLVALRLDEVESSDATLDSLNMTEVRQDSFFHGVSTGHPSPAPSSTPLPTSAGPSSVSTSASHPSSAPSTADGPSSLPASPHPSSDQPSASSSATPSPEAMLLVSPVETLSSGIIPQPTSGITPDSQATEPTEPNGSCPELTPSCAGDIEPSSLAHPMSDSAPTEGHSSYVPSLQASLSVPDGPEHSNSFPEPSYPLDNTSPDHVTHEEPSPSLPSKERTQSSTQSDICSPKALRPQPPSAVSHQTTPPRARRATPPLSPRRTPPRTTNSPSPDRVLRPLAGPRTSTEHGTPPPSSLSSQPSPRTSPVDTAPEMWDSPSDAHPASPPPSTYQTPPTEVDSDVSTRSSTKRRSAASSSGPHPKRPRTRQSSASALSSRSSPELSTITPPPGAPKWFEDALLMLQGYDEPQLGSQWSALLDVWTQFEAQANFKAKGKLGVLDRPMCIGEWIQRRRSTTWRPTFDVREIEKKFMSWWLSLQPEWRVSKGKLRVKAIDGDWDCLRKPGLNGLYSVMVALFYWGLAVGQGTAEQSQWLKALNDVHTAISCMLRLKEQDGEQSFSE